MIAPVNAPAMSTANLPDSRAAWHRLALAMLVGTISCAGMWTVVVALPAVQSEFGTLRAGASLPYTFAMFGFAAGSIGMGRVADRYGMAVPVAIGGAALGLGYLLAGLSSSLWQFALAHGFLIGFGAAAGFAPMIADISHWFVKHRGIAVVVAASGNYLAGAIWPLVVQQGMATWGWRPTHIALGLFIAATMIPLSLAFRSRPAAASMAQAEAATQARQGGLGISPNTLQGMLFVAGFACCVAMAMPQVHIVAYCSDLGYGVARGAQMLGLMLALGIVSRIASGWVADRIGGVPTLLIGSVMQAVALFLYLWFDGLTSLFVISALFGLFQGGIVPMYAVIIREFLPPREAGVRIGLVITATIFGMAFGGWLSGLIFDLTGSYRVAFLNGLVWNMLNIAVILWLWLRPKPAMQPA